MQVQEITDQGKPSSTVDEQKLKQINDQIQSTLSQLKTEFFGIDSQLEHLLRLLQPFLVDPNQFEDRPLIINLWGMTGVGKSEVVKRALELLDLWKTTASFDMGEYTSAYGGYDLKEKLVNLHEEAEGGQGTILVFDEIQHIKTLDEKKAEVSNPVGRVLWEILDKGTVTEATFSRYYQRQVKVFIQRLEHCVLMKGLKIENNQIVSSSASWHSAASGSRWVTKGSKEEDEEESIGATEYVITPGFAFFLVSAFPQYFKTTIPNSELMLESASNESGWNSGRAQADESLEMEWFQNQFCCSEAMKTGEAIIGWLKGILDAATIQVQHSFNPLCTIVIGNLDEAYGMADEAGEGTTLDSVYQLSLTVSLHNVKQALMQRFRPEQVARLGHNHVIYPSLNEDAYRRIIRQQMTAAAQRHSKIYGFDIKYGKSIEDLIFYEVVTPTQGARCVRSGASALLDSYCPNIALEYTQRKAEGPVKIGFSESKEAFRITCGEHSWYQPIHLQVRTRRYAIHDDSIYAVAVHEAGHAIVMMATQGVAPQQINCVYTIDKNGSATEKFGYRRSKVQKIDDLAILLAGYEAELAVFGEDWIGGGAGSDIRTASTSALVMAGELGLGKEFRGRTRWAFSAGQGNHSFAATEAVQEMEDEARVLLEQGKQKAASIIQANFKVLTKLGAHLAKYRRMNDREIDRFFKDNPVQWTSTEPSYRSLLESHLENNDEPEITQIPTPVG